MFTLWKEVTLSVLEPATKQWEDKSDLKRFMFVFFCDCCGRSFCSSEYPFHSGFRPKILMSESERRAREILWKYDHDAALERANVEMLQNYIHRCEICDDHVCGNCVYECDELEGGVCCEKCLRKRGYHGRKLCE